MAISFAECAAQFEQIRRRAESAAEPCAMAMAEAFKDHVSRVTLRKSQHDRLSKTPAPPGGPPSMVSGHLAGSFVVYPGPSGGGVGRATVGNTAIYAAVQQGGRVIHVRNRRALMWRTSYITDATNLEKSFREGGGTWLNFAPYVNIPERPYFDVDAAIPEIEARKIAAFMAIVWGR